MNNQKVSWLRRHLLVNATEVKYRPSLLSMPDLPHWMKFTYSDFYHDGYIYGVHDRETNVTLEVT